MDIIRKLEVYFFSFLPDYFHFTFPAKKIEDENLVKSQIGHTPLTLLSFATPTQSYTSHVL